MGVYFNKITSLLDIAGCPNRCKHCWIGHSPNGNLSIKDLKYMADSFSTYTDNLEIYSWFREPDFKYNYKELWDLENKLSKNTKPKRFELLSFWRINRDLEYVKWAYDIGVKKCQLTFFGLEEKTDYYIGRKGAFKELITATEILLENNIAPRWQIFVNKDNLDEILEVIKLSEKMKLKERCLKINNSFELFIHQGSCDGENEKFYDIRITSDDLYKIPKEFHSLLGIEEKILFSELLKDTSTIDLREEEPVFYVTKDFDVYPNITSINPWWYLGNLKTDGVKKVLSNYKNNNSLAQKISFEVPLCKLAEKYGNPNSTRLFSKDDYLIYLLNQYCKNL